MNSYKKLCTEFYDIDKPNAPADAFEFYLHYAQQAKGAILEPMCGSGRFLLPLLEYGFSIDGIDASDDMLKACRENGHMRRLTPNLFKQFLHQLELPQRYDLGIIPAGSFCLITNPLEIQEVSAFSTLICFQGQPLCWRLSGLCHKHRRVMGHGADVGLIILMAGKL